MPVDLSLIIPCYNEGTHIKRSIRELLFALKSSHLNYEIVMVDDCSTDDTRAQLTEIAKLDPRIVLVFNPHNLGRGATVMKGMRIGTGKVVGFIDIDLSTQPIYIPYLTQLILDDQVDVATCHRSYKIELSVLHRVFHRLVLSYGYRLFGRFFFGHGLKDTETGFKFFNREKILPLLDLIEDPHWFWDTEIMVYAKLAGYRIREVNSIFVRRPEKPSTVKIVRDVITYLKKSWAFTKTIKRYAIFGVPTINTGAKVLLYSMRNESIPSGEWASGQFVMKILRESGVTFRTVASCLMGSPFAPLKGIACMVRLRQILKSAPPDTLVMKIPTVGQLPAARWLSRNYSGRLIIWVEGLAWRPTPLRLSLWMFLSEPVLLLGRIFLNNRIWARLFKGRACEFVVSSEVQRQELLSLVDAKSQIHVIPNGSLMGLKDSTSLVRTSHKRKVIGYIGHSYVTKGVYDLLEAFEDLRKKGFDFEGHFALSGAGSERFANRARKSGFQVSGKVSPADFYASLDLIAIPYWADWGTNVYPNVLLESMHFGVPVITSDLPVTRELFSENQMAVFVDRASPAALSAALEKIISGQTALPQASVLMRHFQQTYDPKLVGTKWIQLLNPAQ